MTAVTQEEVVVYVDKMRSELQVQYQTELNNEITKLKEEAYNSQKVFEENFNAQIRMITKRQQ